MGRLVEVLAVEVEELDPEGGLAGANIDGPAAGRRVAAAALEIGGWALGRSDAAAQVEARVADRVIARAPVRQPRPDIAAAFPDLPWAERSGFELAVDAGSLPAGADLEVQARVGAATVPIGRLRLRPHWREELRLEPPALISVVIPSDEAAPGLDLTLASLATQRHPFTEIVIAHPRGSLPPSPQTWEERGIRGIEAGPAPAALRNEGIRRSNGELLLFVAPGTALVAGALADGVRRLIEAPEAAALLDAETAGAVRAALYRRSAFEELRGFDSATADCDRDLAQRAERYGTLSAPGSLAAGGG